MRPTIPATAALLALLAGCAATPPAAPVLQGSTQPAERAKNVIFFLGDGMGINTLTAETYTSNVRLNAAFNRYFEPGPGRNAYAGVTLDWKFR